MTLATDLSNALPQGTILTGEAADERAVGVRSRLGSPELVALPRSTQDVATILRAAHAHKRPVVAWGGKTNLVDGADADGAVALSLERMNRIETIDRQSGVMIVEAGCILQTVCEAAETAGFIFPLDLGARGSATIGGCISTNAGGNRVIRYGMMRNMVLGLEAVLADGTIVSSMNQLIKNNAGYDLKQLFIGSEGTLGVVTRAVLQLQPAASSQCMAVAAVDRFDALPALLQRLQRVLGGSLSAFEVMWSEFYELVTTEPAKGKPPVPQGHPYYVLIESLGSDQESDTERLETALGEALENGEAVDAAIAQSKAQCEAMWALRDDIGQIRRDKDKPMLGFDVGLPIPAMEAYVENVRAAMTKQWPDSARLVVFGHLGDGNLHLVTGVGEVSEETVRRIEEIVFTPLQAVGGSISAEHGIGRKRRPYLSLSRSRAEIDLMKTLKGALDPFNILNPDIIFS